MQVQRTGVGVSTICPGYVSDAGMFWRLSTRTGQKAPVTLGSSTPQDVAGAVERAILKDRPEILVNPMPVRFFLVLQSAFPRFTERLAHLMGVHGLYKRAVEIDRANG